MISLLMNEQTTATWHYGKYHQVVLLHMMFQVVVVFPQGWFSVSCWGNKTPSIRLPPNIGEDNIFTKPLSYRWLEVTSQL